MSTLKNPSVLAFERKLDISDAYLWQMAGDKGERMPVIVREKSLRGTISNRLKVKTANNPADLDAEIEKANLQRVDAAFLENGYDTLGVTFTFKVLPFSGRPNVCNQQDYQKKLEDLVREYQQASNNYEELAKRYATNLANARWLWRNRFGAESIVVEIRNGQERLVFERAHEISLNHFDDQSTELKTLTAWIQKGLTGGEFTLLEVEGRVKVGNAQEVFPSQELVLDKSDTKSKVLYRVGKDQNQAGMHAQKIGNAIRTIDNWYPDAEFPIAVEVYGSVTSLGKAYRQPKEKQDFYSLLDAWMLKDNKPELAQQHYLMALLIRGGVFGEAEKENK